MTSTDSSASNNNNQNSSSTSEPVAALETNSKIMSNESDTSQVLANDTTQETKDNNTDTSNISSSEASTSPSSSSPTSSSPTSSNDTSTDKTQTLEEKSSNKDVKSTNNGQKTNNHSKKSSVNQNQNSIENSPIASGTMPNQQPHQQFINYYPTYIPRQGRQISQNVQAPYTQLDGTAPQQWPHAVAAAAMAAMAANDPMALAQYMGNGPNGVQNGVPPQGPYPPNGNPADPNQQHYDQFSFGFTPAFGFGYTGNGSIDYAAIQAAQSQGGSNLNPQSNQWTPSANSATTGTTTTNPSNPTSSPANTTTSSNDTTSSVPSTVPSETSTNNSNAKWMQVMQDPLAVHEFNAYQQQQLSPVDLYTPQHHHQPHHGYRSHGHHHYQRHQQHLQHNYHHYQYNNPYHIQHYQNQYTNMQHPMHHHHYNSHNSNKYNNYQKNNYNHNNNENTGSSYHIHDNNNNSNKSNNLNNTESSKSVDQIANSDSTVNQSGQETTTSNENKSESGSKSWASIVGVSSSTSSANIPAQQTSTGSSPALNEASQPQNYQFEQTNSFSEYSLKSKNNYYKNNYKHQQSNNYEIQQQAFDLTNRSFPPINASDSELNETNKKTTVKKIDNSFEQYPAQQFSQNSKKQQQYNNYQRQQQQQFNLPVGKYQNYQNGSVNYSFNNQRYNNESSRGEKPSFYNKRHQPTQHTLSSFLNILDKSKFDDAKKNNTSNKTTNVTQQPNNNGNSMQIVDSAVDQLSNQVVNLNIDPSQLTVYTNPSAYNPKEFNTSPKAARFFVIKSYSEDDIHRSIKYNIWCSTEHGNRRLDSAYFKGDGQVPVYLFFSVNGSGHFCGMAEMQSRVDYNKKTGVWAQDKWRGCFQVKWIYVKDVPNSLLRNIKLENNDNKPVTNSRDTQEIPYDKGRQVLKVFHTYNHSSSILDDFEHYERKQEEDKNILKGTHHNFEHQNVVLSGEQMNNQGQIHNIQNPNLKNDSNDQNSEITKDDSVQNSSTTNTTTSSPSASSSSSTSSIDESKQQQQKGLEKTQQLVSTSS